MKHTNLLISGLATIMLASCSSEEKSTSQTDSTQVAVVDTATATVDEMANFKFQMVIANIPSPFETIDALSKSDVEPNTDLLNPTENASRYLTSTQKALNYGVYGVDLAYLATNNKLSQVQNYFKTTRELAVSLDAAESFDKVVSSRIEDNMDNKDTITQLMDAAFAETDQYLRNNERQLAATQMLTGSWVESQYLTLSTIDGQQKSEKNEFLFDKVFEQKTHLGNLMNLLKEYEKETTFAPVIKQLSALNDKFSSVNSADDVTPEKVSELLASIKKAREVIVK